MPKKIRTNIYIDEKLYREVRSRLVKQGRSFSGWVSDLAEIFVSVSVITQDEKRESWKRTED